MRQMVSREAAGRRFHRFLWHQQQLGFLARSKLSKLGGFLQIKADTESDQIRKMALLLLRKTSIFKEVETWMADFCGF